MKEAFFYSPTASPVLLKVVYNVTYGHNIITATAKEIVRQCNNSSQFEEGHLTATSDVVSLARLSYPLGRESLETVARVL